MANHANPALHPPPEPPPLLPPDEEAGTPFEEEDASKSYVTTEFSVASSIVEAGRPVYMTSGTVVDSIVAITVSLGMTSPSALVLPIANVALSASTLLPISVHPSGTLTVRPFSFDVHAIES